MMCCFCCARLTGGDCRRRCVREGGRSLARGSHSPELGARPSARPARAGRRWLPHRAPSLARLDASPARRLRVPQSILLGSRCVSGRVGAAARRVNTHPPIEPPFVSTCCSILNTRSFKQPIGQMSLCHAVDVRRVRACAGNGALNWEGENRKET